MSRGVPDQRRVPYLSPASFWAPEYSVKSAWIGHAPFAFWIISALKPRTFVELGTARGYSYFAFCQAVSALRLKTLCYAIDTWRGDEHSGHYGEEVFHHVMDYNLKQYASFSKLLRSTFDDALVHFGNATVDLLHIDGRHYYEDVRHDFESWRSKLSDRAIVLFHDINVHERNFGVFRYWNEIRTDAPSFEFQHCHGLGVLGYGSALSEPMKDFFAVTSDTGEAAQVRRAYVALAKRARVGRAHK